jgi:hypothetical protein
MTKFKLVFILLLVLASCKKTAIPIVECPSSNALDAIKNRNFKMGFTTWSFGTEAKDRESTYDFISANSDIYAEQIDDRIPWSAWINNTALPGEFVDNINYRVSKKKSTQQLLLSISLLNVYRDDLLADVNGTIPTYQAMNDLVIENAYFLHLKYLIDKFQPNYLVLAMEVNELRLKSTSRWNEYKLLMAKIRSRVKQAYPSLPLSESVTLHNWYNPATNNPTAYGQEIRDYVDQLDFIAISFYPFLKALNTKQEFQQAFDFLHSQVTKPIAVVETGHIAEDLDLKNLGVFLKGNACEQRDYLEVLLLNTYNKNYKFIIWAIHKDYDKLFATVPAQFRDLFQIWKDTGLIDQDDNQRPAYDTWTQVLKK